MNKRGQFFLIAAVVIVAILIGLSLVYTSTRTPINEEQEVTELSDEIYFEGAQVIDNGIYKESSENVIEDDLQILMGNYAKLYPDSEIISIYGDSVTTRVCETTGGVGFSTTLTQIDCTTSTVSKDSPIITSNEGKINVVVDGENYEFEDTPGETFYVIIRKESRSGEIIVKT